MQAPDWGGGSTACVRYNKNPTFGTKIVVPSPNRRGGEESVNEYMFWFWRPMGNLPDLEVLGGLSDMFGQPIFTTKLPNLNFNVTLRETEAKHLALVA